MGHCTHAWAIVPPSISTLIGIFAQFEGIVIVEIGMDLYNMKNEVPQNSLYFWNYQCSIVYFLQDSNNWITFFDDLFFFKLFFSIDFFLSTTNIISTIREQTGIRRKRNKFVLFDNHSLISDRFSFFLTIQSTTIVFCDTQEIYDI